MLVLKFYADVLAHTVFRNDFPFRGPVFARHGFIEAVFHDVSEFMELGAVIGNGIIIAKSPHFSIVLVQYAQVRSSGEFSPVHRISDFFTIPAHDFHGSQFQQLLLYDRG